MIFRNSFEAYCAFMNNLINSKITFIRKANVPTPFNVLSSNTHHKEKAINVSRLK